MLVVITVETGRAAPSRAVWEVEPRGPVSSVLLLQVQPLLQV